MVTTLFTGHSKTFICKRLSELPPVISDWQQSCKQPRCPHFRHGGCFNPGRQSASTPCPFDEEELLLMEAEPLDLEDSSFDDNGMQPWLTAQSKDVSFALFDNFSS